MVNTKTYVVIKDGETVKELKTLASAKKLADAEGGEVICEGQTVYTVDSLTLPADPTTSTSPEPEEKIAEAEEPKEEKYKLLSKMNIRIAPSLKADKVGVVETGTVVDVTAIENDWMRVKNGAGEVFILYGGGKFAERA